MVFNIAVLFSFDFVDETGKHVVGASLFCILNEPVFEKDFIGTKVTKIRCGLDVFDSITPNSLEKGVFEASLNLNLALDPKKWDRNNLDDYIKKLTSGFGITIKNIA